MAQERRGKLEHQPGHVIDIMATCVDVAGIPHPGKHGERDLLDLEGVSLRPAFLGKPIGREDALYFEHHLNSAVREGDWKIVRRGQTGRPAKLQAWELYNVHTDRSELHDIAAQQPERVKKLSAMWEAWAIRANIKPWPWTIEGDE